ncbi:MAG TPA: cell division protein FtsA [Clostridia bacterium]
MSKHAAAILSINSSRITVAVGSRSVNNTFNISSVGEAAYDGYSNGEFIEPRKLSDAVSEALEAVKSVQNTFGRIYVGVPADFLECIVKDVNLSFLKPKAVKPDDIERLLDQGGFDVPDYMLINRSPLYFDVDGLKSLKYPETKVSKISAKVSYIYAKNIFIELFNAILESEGFSEVRYLGAPLCQYLYLIEDKSAEKKSVILDLGHISSGIYYAQGEGLTGLQNFSAGSGYLTLTLMEGLQITYKQAEGLKQQLVLTLDPSENERYIIDEFSAAVSAAKANELAIESIYNMAESAAENIEKMGVKFDEYTSVYMTGEEICSMRGVKDIFEKVLGISIEILKPQVPMLDRPQFSQIVGLLDLALTHN